MDELIELTAEEFEAAGVKFERVARCGLEDQYYQWTYIASWPTSPGSIHRFSATHHDLWMLKMLVTEYLTISPLGKRLSTGQ